MRDSARHGCFLTTCLALIVGVAASAQPADALPEGFVHLRDVAPNVQQEIRYHTAYNFVGEPIAGYEAPTCILTAEAARALAAVQADLEEQGLGLKVYDCYRPQRAVDHFVRWVRSDDRRMKTAFYPDEPKDSLFARGYIARRSGHSRGSTVDLTVVPLPAPELTPYPPADAPPGSLRDCTSPDRFPETGLDMGTGYDCLSPRSATEHPAAGADVLANRRLLRTAMMEAGFRNYHKEWWHYSLRAEPFPDTYFDFPVR